LVLIKKFSCAIAGSGVLGLPYSLNQCGWIGVLFIILAAGMSIYTGRMLIECLYIDVKTGEPNGDLHEVGERSFGRPGKWFIQAVHYAVTLGCTTLYILLMGINIFSILKSYDIHFSQSYM
jgi:amino acid permease